ncbi:hypothetical protein BN1708_012373 [Verticillium longisporum]|uniref:Uncharacterized protein n=1 Tax=Verticillium longisporum TaxID=100787 RepID=A0A0G4L929_VERLO|nr:hypothetical protein BN1708_012373 [Verticillium longisporum]
MQCALGAIVAVAARAPRHVLPCGAKAAAGAGQQALLLVGLGVVVELGEVELGGAEEAGDEDDEKDGEKGKLGPEGDGAEKGPRDGDAVEKLGHDGRRAHAAGLLGQGLGAADEVVGAVAAVGPLAVAVGRRAPGLGAVDGVLGRDEHGDGVVDGEDDEGQHDGGDEQGLRRRAALADLEDADPEEADADGGDAGDGAAEEEQDEEGHEDVVDGEGARRLEEDPVDGLENVEVAEDVAAALLADGVLGLVNARDEHGDPDEEGDEEQEDAAEQLDGTENGADLEPELVDLAASLAGGLGGDALAAAQGALLTHEGLELAAVLGGHAVLAAGVAHLELTLALLVLLQGGGGRLGELGRRDGRGRLDEGHGEQGQSGGRVDDVEKGAEGDEEAEGESQGLLPIVLGEESLEVVEIPAGLGVVAGGGHEEADEEEDQDERHKDSRVLEGADETGGKGSGALLVFDLVVLLVEEVGEGDDEETQQGVEAVERVVDDAKRLEHVVDATFGGPVLLDAEGGRGRGRHEGNVDRQQEDGGEQGGQADNGDSADEGGSVAGGLPREGRDGGNEEAEGDDGGVGDPDQTGLEEAGAGHGCHVLHDVGVLLLCTLVKGVDEEKET